MVQWWLLALAIPPILVTCWLGIVRNIRRFRVHGEDLRVLQVILVAFLVGDLVLFAFALAHVGGSVGSAFAWMPQDLTPSAPGEVSVRATLSTLCILGFGGFGIQIIFVAVAVALVSGIITRVPQRFPTSPTDAEP